MDLSSYAGKTLTMKIVNIPVDENELLSDAGSIEINIPHLTQVKLNLQTEPSAAIRDVVPDSEKETAAMEKEVNTETENPEK